MRYQKTKLDQRGIKYIEAELRVGTKYNKELSKAILKARDLNFGNTFSYLPDEIEVDDVYSFEFGSKNIQEEESCDCLKSLIFEYLSSQNDNIIVLQNSNIDASDPWLQSAESRILAYKNEVYHLLTTEDTSADRIEKGIAEGFGGWLNVGFFSLIPKDIDATRLVNLDEDLLKLIAQKTVVEDIITGGLGIADDSFTIPAGARMVAAGLGF